MENKKLAEARRIAAPLIKKFEGLKLETYQDVTGTKTIGWGHTGTAAYIGNKITKGGAETLLEVDMIEAQKPLVRFSNQLNTNQLAALTSFIFNVGSGHFQSSTLRLKLLTRKYELAANEFLKWNKASVNGVLIVFNGLTGRREEERDLFLSKISAKKK